MKVQVKGFDEKGQVVFDESRSALGVFTTASNILFALGEEPDELGITEDDADRITRIEINIERGRS